MRTSPGAYAPVIVEGVVGVVVQVMTLVRDQNDEVFDLPHGEWSVQLTWSAPEVQSAP